MKINAADRIEALENLTRWLERGQTLFITLRHRSESGMSRYYDVFIIEDKDLIRITWAACAAGEYGHSYDDRRDALRINGCGFSGAQEITEGIAHAVFNDGRALKYREF